MKSLPVVIIFWLMMGGSMARAGSSCDEVFAKSGNIYELPSFEMRSQYVGESQARSGKDEGRPLRRVPSELEERRPRRVVYWSNEEVGQWEIFLGKEGLFRDRSGELLNSVVMPGMRATPIFVARIVEGHLRFYMYPFPELGIYHHSSLSHGAKVVMAGDISFVSGKIHFISNRSGHYHPSKEAFRQFLTWLEAQGVDLTATEVMTYPLSAD